MSAWVLRTVCYRVLAFKLYFLFLKHCCNEICSTCPTVQGLGNQVDKISGFNDWTDLKWSFYFKWKCFGCLNDFQITCSRVLPVSKYFWMPHTNSKHAICFICGYYFHLYFRLSLPFFLLLSTYLVTLMWTYWELTIIRDKIQVHATNLTKVL